MIWKSKWGFQKWEKRPKGLRNTSSFLWKLCVWVPNCHPAVMFQKETFLRRILGTKEEGANPTNHSLRVSRSHVSQIRWYLNMRKISQFQFKSMPHIWHNFLKGSHDKTIKKKCVSTTDIKIYWYFGIISYFFQIKFEIFSVKFMHWKRNRDNPKKLYFCNTLSGTP